MGILSDFPELVKSGFEIRRKSSQAADSFGGESESWPADPHVTVDGVLRQLRGGKRYVAATHGYDADCRLYVDPPADIEAGDRVTYDGKTYEIKFVDPVMGSGELLQIDMLWISTPTDEGA